MKETGYISQHRKPQVTQHVLARLGERTGPVNGLFLFRLLGSTGTEGIFTVLHIAKTLLRREFEFVLNDAYEAQVFVRATSTADNDVLESASAKEKAFSLAHAVVKIYKIVELNLVPRKEDKLLNMPLCTYPQEYDHLSVDRMRQLSYPTGFSCQGDPIEKWKNPHLSETTMNILGVSEGTPAGLTRVVVKYMFRTGTICYPLSVVPSDFRFKHAVDQDGSLYMKFVDPVNAEAMARRNYFVDRFMIKFYLVNSVTKCSKYFDKAKTNKVHYRNHPDDSFKPIHTSN